MGKNFSAPQCRKIILKDTIRKKKLSNVSSVINHILRSYDFNITNMKITMARFIIVQNAPMLADQKHESKDMH